MMPVTCVRVYVRVRMCVNHYKDVDTKAARSYFVQISPFCHTAIEWQVLITLQITYKIFTR